MKKVDGTPSRDIFLFVKAKEIKLGFLNERVLPYKAGLGGSLV